jgi:hypothetical protein
VAADALVLKVREGGRTVNVHALLATGVNAEGSRGILGLRVSSAEDGAGWLAFFRDLTARGLAGVAQVSSDAHRGLTEATLPVERYGRTGRPVERLPCGGGVHQDGGRQDGGRDRHLDGDVRARSVPLGK